MKAERKSKKQTSFLHNFLKLKEIEVFMDKVLLTIEQDSQQVSQTLETLLKLRLFVLWHEDDEVLRPDDKRSEYGVIGHQVDERFVVCRYAVDDIIIARLS